MLQNGSAELLWPGLQAWPFGGELGAAGAIEAIFCLLSIRDQKAPPTLNLDNPAVETAIDLAPKKAVSREITKTMSNSFGFGGTNATIILGKCES